MFSAATDNYIKINRAPHLLVLDLYGEVDELQTKVMLSAAGVKFIMFKVCAYVVVFF